MSARDVARKIGKKPWAGIDHNESQYHRVQPGLAGIVLDGVEGQIPNARGWRQMSAAHADEMLARGHAVLENLEAQSSAPRGEAKRFMDRTLREVRRLVTEAEEVRRGKRAPKL